MVANRYRGVRCALCWNVESARLARSHNDTNVLALDKRLLTADLALQIVDIWLETEFAGGLKHRSIVDTPRSHYGSENDVSVLALMAALLEAEKDGCTDHLRDTHWNAHGNRIAGKQAADFLLHRLSLGQDEPSEK